MKRKRLFKTISWLVVSLFFGFLPLWVKMVNSSIDFSKVFNFKDIVSDCSILYFCSAITVGVCTDFFYNSTNRYLLLKDLKKVIGLPLFIFSWTIVITLNVSYMTEKNINITAMSIHTALVFIATIIYITLMKLEEFSKAKSL